MSKQSNNRTYISMLSGGRDSTAMTLMLLDKKEPLDYIVFGDTGLEHEEMYEYIDKLDIFFQRKYNMKITRLYPARDYETYIKEPKTKGDNIGKTRGTPMIADICFWRVEAKREPVKRWIKEVGLKEEDVIQYNGFVYGEFERVQNMPNNVQAPLYEWKMTEADVSDYLKKNQMENKLYKYFSRTGCAVCGKNKIDDKYILYKHYPQKWEFMTRIEKELNQDPNRSGVFPRWHTTMFIEDMLKVFKKKDKQPTFEFDDEPAMDCFCKI